MAKQRAEIGEESKGLIAQLSKRLKGLESRAPDVRKNPYEPFSSNLFGAGIGTASGTQYGVDFSSHYTGTKPKIHKHRESKSVLFGVGHIPVCHSSLSKPFLRREALRRQVCTLTAQILCLLLELGCLIDCS